MDLALRRRSDTADAAARLAGRIFSASSQRHFRQNHHISNDTTTDTTSDVISGKWKLKPSRSIEMSPGSRPHGSLASQGPRRPTATSSGPNTTSKRCMMSPLHLRRTVAPASLAIGPRAPHRRQQPRQRAHEPCCLTKHLLLRVAHDLVVRIAIEFALKRLGAELAVLQA